MTQNTARAGLAALEKRMIQEVSQSVADAGTFVEGEAVRLVKEAPATGSVYENTFLTINGHSFPTKKKRPGGPHRASAPGEPYASDTGATVGQIGPIELSSDGLTATVPFHGENARRLEFGTEKMRPRPVARPAIENSESEVRRIIGAGVERAMKLKG